MAKIAVPGTNGLRIEAENYQYDQNPFGVEVNKHNVDFEGLNQRIRVFVAGYDVTPDVTNCNITQSMEGNLTCSLVLGNVKDNYTITRKDLDEHFTFEKSTDKTSTLRNPQLKPDILDSYDIDKLGQFGSEFGDQQNIYKYEIGDVYARESPKGTKDLTLKQMLFTVKWYSGLRKYEGDTIFDFKEPIIVFLQGRHSPFWYFGFTGFIVGFVDSFDYQGNPAINIEAQSRKYQLQLSTETINPALSAALRFESKIVNNRSDTSNTQVLQDFTQNKLLERAILDLFLNFASKKDTVKTDNLPIVAINWWDVSWKNFFNVHLRNRDNRQSYSRPFEKQKDLQEIFDFLNDAIKGMFETMLGSFTTNQNVTVDVRSDGKLLRTRQASGSKTFFNKQLLCVTDVDTVVLYNSINFNTDKLIPPAQTKVVKPKKTVGGKQESATEPTTQERVIGDPMNDNYSALLSDNIYQVYIFTVKPYITSNVTSILESNVIRYWESDFGFEAGKVCKWTSGKSVGCIGIHPALNESFINKFHILPKIYKLVIDNKDEKLEVEVKRRLRVPIVEVKGNKVLFTFGDRKQPSLFDLDKAILKEEFKDQLIRDIIPKILEDPDRITEITIIGHTDMTGGNQLPGSSDQYIAGYEKQLRKSKLKDPGQITSFTTKFRDDNIVAYDSARAYNNTLSKKRARAVADFLLNPKKFKKTTVEGLEGKIKIEIKTDGEDFQIPAADPGKGIQEQSNIGVDKKTQNRRAVITVTGIDSKQLKPIEEEVITTRLVRCIENADRTPYDKLKEQVFGVPTETQRKVTGFNLHRPKFILMMPPLYTSDTHPVSAQFRQFKAFDSEFVSIKSLLDRLMEHLQFRYYETPQGDIIMEAMNYDMSPWEQSIAYGKEDQGLAGTYFVKSEYELNKNSFVAIPPKDFIQFANIQPTYISTFVKQKDLLKNTLPIVTPKQKFRHPYLFTNIDAKQITNSFDPSNLFTKIIVTGNSVRGSEGGAFNPFASQNLELTRLLGRMDVAFNSRIDSFINSGIPIGIYVADGFEEEIEDLVVANERTRYSLQLEAPTNKLIKFVLQGDEKNFNKIVELLETKLTPQQTTQSTSDTPNPTGSPTTIGTDENKSTTPPPTAVGKGIGDTIYDFLKNLIYPKVEEIDLRLFNQKKSTENQSTLPKSKIQKDFKTAIQTLSDVAEPKITADFPLINNPQPKGESLFLEDYPMPKEGSKFGTADRKADLKSYYDEKSIKQPALDATLSANENKFNAYIRQAVSYLVRKTVTGRILVGEIARIDGEAAKFAPLISRIFTQQDYSDLRRQGQYNPDSDLVRLYGIKEAHTVHLNYLQNNLDCRIYAISLFNQYYNNVYSYSISGLPLTPEILVNKTGYFAFKNFVGLINQISNSYSPNSTLSTTLNVSYIRRNILHTAFPIPIFDEIDPPVVANNIDRLIEDKNQPRFSMFRKLGFLSESVVRTEVPLKDPIQQFREELPDRITDLQNNIKLISDSTENSISGLKSQLNIIDKQLQGQEKYRNAIIKVEQEIARITGDVSDLEERGNEIDEEIEFLEKQNKSLSNTVGLIKLELDDLLVIVDDPNSSQADKAAAIVQINIIEDRLEELDEKIMDNETKIKELEEERKALIDDINNIVDENLSDQQKVSSLIALNKVKVELEKKKNEDNAALNSNLTSFNIGIEIVYGLIFSSGLSEEDQAQISATLLTIDFDRLAGVEFFRIHKDSSILNERFLNLINNIHEDPSSVGAVIATDTITKRSLDPFLKLATNSRPFLIALNDLTDQALKLENQRVEQSS